MVNHLSTILLSALSSAVLLAGAAAQRVVVVDASNGPGTDHTDLASAFAGMQDGDYVILRAGTYTGVDLQTPRSFVMVGEGDPIVEPAVGANAGLRLTFNSSQYQRVAFRGITFHSLETGQPALDVRTNYLAWPAPTVQLEDCSVLSMSPVADRVGLQAESVGVTAQRCTMSLTRVRQCLVSLVECTVEGHDQSWNGPFSMRAQSAMDVQDSEVWIVDSQLSAGDSNGEYGQPASCIGITDTSFTSGSLLHVSGACTLQADQSPSPAWPMPAYVIENYRPWWPQPAELDIEPAVTLVPTAGGPTFNSNINTTAGTAHSLTASPAPIGGSLDCTAHGDTNDVALMLLASASRAHRPLGIPVLMDTAAFVVHDFGLVGATQSYAFAPFAIPNDLNLRGLVLQAHAVFLTAGGEIVGSNPVSGVLFD